MARERAETAGAEVSAAIAHVHGFVTFPEGEAICFGCGDLYIFQTTLSPDEIEEYRKYAEEVKSRANA